MIFAFGLDFSMISFFFYFYFLSDSSSNSLRNPKNAIESEPAEDIFKPGKED